MRIEEVFSLYRSMKGQEYPGAAICTVCGFNEELNYLIGAVDPVYEQLQKLGWDEIAKNDIIATHKKNKYGYRYLTQACVIPLPE